jgi:hypothetical protein
MFGALTAYADMLDGLSGITDEASVRQSLTASFQRLLAHGFRSLGRVRESNTQVIGVLDDLGASLFRFGGSHASIKIFLNFVLGDF